MDVKPVVSDLLPHKLPAPPSGLPSRNHTPLTPSHQPCLSQCSPILRYLWWEQRFLFLQDADLHISVLEIFWWFGVGVEEFSFLGRGGGTDGWLDRGEWRRSGEDGGGEIGREGSLVGRFGFGLRFVLGVGGAGVYLGVFGERVGGEWLFFWLLMLA